MKKILVPTDFSTVAWQASVYAAELAKITRASLVLYHSTDLRPCLADGTVVSLTDEEQQTRDYEQLRLWADRLRTETAFDLKVYYECTANHSTVADEICNAAKKLGVDLIVMGTRGLGAGAVARRVVGSVSTAVMRQTCRPLMLIPENTTFRPPTTIVFATDYDSIARQQELTLLGQLAKFFESRVVLLHVNQPEPVSSGSETTAQAEQMMDLLEEQGLHAGLDFTEDQDTAAGIARYIKKERADWLVMIPRWHSFLDRLMKEPVTKQLAFETTIPLLTFPMC